MEKIAMIEMGRIHVTEMEKITNDGNGKKHETLVAETD